MSWHIIVENVALLQAGDFRCHCRPMGIHPASSFRWNHIAFACCHRAGQMGEELNAMMNQGCTVLDVIDGPPICRQLTAHCGYPIGMSGSVCRPLQGEEGHPPIPIHRGMDLHTHLCPDPSAIDHMWVALKKLRFLFQYQ